jgi:hypothetical protein
VEESINKRKEKKEKDLLIIKAKESPPQALRTARKTKSFY